MKNEAEKLADTLAKSILPATNTKDRERQSDLAKEIAADLMSLGGVIVAGKTTVLKTETRHPLENTHEPHDND